MSSSRAVPSIPSPSRLPAAPVQSPSLSPSVPVSSATASSSTSALSLRLLASSLSQASSISATALPPDSAASSAAPAASSCCAFRHLSSSALAFRSSSTPGSKFSGCANAASDLARLRQSLPALPSPNRPKLREDRHGPLQLKTRHQPQVLRALPRPNHTNHLLHHPRLSSQVFQAKPIRRLPPTFLRHRLRPRRPQLSFQTGKPPLSGPCLLLL